MVGMDSGTPPVLFVVGTAGAGKSSLVTAFQRWSRFLETDAIAVNLDPGASEFTTMLNLMSETSYL